MSTPSNELSAKAQQAVIVLCISMAFIAWMAVKLPMPALPILAKVFHSSNEVFKVSVTLNLLMFSISQLFWGPVSDRWGRRMAMIWAFIIAIVGTLLALCAVNLSMYIAGRMIEGFAVGSAAPVGRALLADSFDKVKMAKIYAYFAISALLPPAVGPVIGGYLLTYLGWRSIFAFFLLIAVGYLWALTKWLPETHKQMESRIHLGLIANKIRFIASHRYFWRYVITYAIINGFMIAYYAAMPYWFVVHFHMAEDSYAWLAFLPIASYIVGSLITNRLLNRYSMDAMMLLGIVLALGVSGWVIVLAFLSQPTVWMLSSIMTVFSVASGVVTPMANASLMHHFRDKVTILSAVMSGCRVGGAGLLVLVSANIHLNSYWPLASYMSVLSVLALLGFLLFRDASPNR